MSKGIRILVGVASILTGALLIVVAPRDEKAIYFYGIATFCAVAAVFFLTSGRAREFCGSLVGVCLLAVCAVYLWHEMTTDGTLRPRHDQPSVRDAILFTLTFGVPGAAYAWRTRFGFRRRAP